MTNNESITAIFKIFHLLARIPKVLDAHCSLTAQLDQSATDCRDGTAMYLDISLIYTVSSYFHDVLDDGHVYALI